MNEYADIIIVGAGPAGLTFARQFKGSNLSITIIEKNPLPSIENPPFDGREIALTHLSKDFLEKCGILNLIPKDKIFKLKEAKVVDGNSDYQLFFPQPTHARGKKIDRLGYLISNCDIRKACYESVKDLPNVTIKTDTTVIDAHCDESGVSVTLSNQEIVNGQLLICADSRFSNIRQKIGIPVDTHQFGRTVICFRMQHTLSNHNTAFECFHYGRTLAVLPLETHLSSMVITIDSAKADQILNMSDAEIAQDIYKETKGRLGTLTIVSDKYTYPLIGVHARRFFDTRTALIGDAAVGMHPVTAHGFNLGIESVAILSDLILKAVQQNKNIADETLLERYSLKHSIKTRILYHGTNLVVNLFTNESPPARLLRGAILRISNQLRPIKKLISKQLTG